MHVLTVIAEMGSGGAETVVSDLAGHLRDGDHRVTVASAGGWRTAGLRARGVQVLDVPLRRGDPVSLLRSSVRLRRLGSVEPVDVVHAHNVRATLAARLALGVSRPGRGRPPLVSTVHGLAAEDYATAARVLRRCADRVVAVSADVADRLTAGGLPAARLQVVENAVVAPAGPPRGEARRRLGLGGQVPVVLSLARLAPPKRHDLLVEAWAQLPGDAVLLVAGDGPLRDAIAGLVARRGLASRVRLLGECRDPGLLLAAADLLVLASDREGMPMAVLEAMAAGVPVVASRVGGLGELDAAAAELVEPGSVDALAAGLRRMLADASLRESRAQAGARLAAGPRAAAVMRAGYLDLYEEMSGVP